MATMMSLGMFVFSLPTIAYDEVQRRASWRWATNARVGARDAAQYVGPDKETISLNGTAFAELQDGRASLDELREMAAEGKAWPLTSGTGEVLGAWVIEGIDERQKHFFDDGIARQIDFGIDLMRVDDAIDAGAAA
jgi:phage protein U